MTPEEYPPPNCPLCDRQMRLAASIPAEAGLPAVAVLRSLIFADFSAAVTVLVVFVLDLAIIGRAHSDWSRGTEEEFRFSESEAVRINVRSPSGATPPPVPNI